MIAVWDRRDAWVGLSSRPERKITGGLEVGTGNTFHESEMALGSEPTDQYAQKVLDDADIVRDAIFHQSKQ
jgi:hypothetical protein